MGFIYKITNLVNGKVYIGQTVSSLQKRWREHSCISASNHCSKLKRAIAKYGKTSFSIIELASCDSIEELNRLEIYYIKEFDSIKNGYNLKEGGNNARLSEETKQKIKKAHTGRKISEETRRRLSESHKGIIPSKEALIKRSKALKEKWRDPEYRKKVIIFGRPVYQFDLYGNFLKKWDHSLQVHKTLKISSGSLSEVLNNKRNVAGGYMWSYNDSIQPYPVKSAYCGIIQKKDEQIVAEYTSLKEASKVTGLSPKSIKRVCDKGRISTGGFSFEYIANNTAPGMAL